MGAMNFCWSNHVEDELFSKLLKHIISVHEA